MGSRDSIIPAFRLPTAPVELWKQWWAAVPTTRGTVICSECGEEVSASQRGLSVLMRW
jgi:hypothetical protein